MIGYYWGDSGSEADGTAFPVSFKHTFFCSWTKPKAKNTTTTSPIRYVENQNHEK